MNKEVVEEKFVHSIAKADIAELALGVFDQK